MHGNGHYLIDFALFYFLFFARKVLPQFVQMPDQKCHHS